MITQRDIDRLLESELNRITRERQALLESREMEVIEASRRRIARKPAAPPVARQTRAVCKRGMTYKEAIAEADRGFREARLKREASLQRSTSR